MSNDTYDNDEHTSYTGKPSWFKIFPKEIIDIIGLQDFDNFSETETEEAIYTVGAATIDALRYYLHKSGDSDSVGSLDDSRQYKTILMLYIKHIAKAFTDYQERVENGRKGGRPKKE